MSTAPPGNVSYIPIVESRDSRQPDTCVRPVRSVAIVVHPYPFPATQIPSETHVPRHLCIGVTVLTKRFSVLLILLISPGR